MDPLGTPTQRPRSRSAPETGSSYATSRAASIAAMEGFFTWLDAKGIQPHNMFQDGAMAPMAKETQAFLRARMAEVEGELLYEVH